MRKECLMLAAALCLCPMPAGSGMAHAAARDGGEYVYDSGRMAPGEGDGDAGMEGYVYEEGTAGDEQGEAGREDAGAGEEKEEGLGDIASGLLNDNKINIAVLALLLAALGVVLYQNGKLAATRKR